MLKGAARSTSFKIADAELRGSDGILFSPVAAADAAVGAAAGAGGAADDLPDLMSLGFDHTYSALGMTGQTISCQCARPSKVVLDVLQLRRLGSFLTPTVEITTNAVGEFDLDAAELSNQLLGEEAESKQDAVVICKTVIDATFVSPLLLVPCRRAAGGEAGGDDGDDFLAMNAGTFSLRTLEHGINGPHTFEPDTTYDDQPAFQSPLFMKPFN